MHVSQLMRTPAVSCRPATTVREVAQLMDSRNVGSVLVVDIGGYLAGIVTDRDVAIRGVAAGRSGDVAVETIMTRDVASIGPATDVTDVAALMEKRGVRRVPVVDDMGKVHGLVAFDDLVRHLGHETDSLTGTLLGQALRSSGW